MSGRLQTTGGDTCRWAALWTLVAGTLRAQGSPGPGCRRRGFLGGLGLQGRHDNAPSQPWPVSSFIFTWTVSVLAMDLP